MTTRETIEGLYALPLKELITRAARVHAEHHRVNDVQMAALVSVKTGGCPEDCAYCPQSAHYATGLQKQALMALDEVTEHAHAAKARGATRLCLGAAWRSVRDGAEFDRVLEMTRAVSAMGLEVCCTLGMLTREQATRLKAAGVYAYNHNIDTSRGYYPSIISTRTYDDRLQTLQHARAAGLTLCTGGIMGMGESDDDRIDFLFELSQIAPESVTINALIAIDGTPLEKTKRVSALELARVIATARCVMSKAMVRLSAGRDGMSDEGQFLCFLAGANSIFTGDKLLTAKNPGVDRDSELLRRVGMSA